MANIKKVLPYGYFDRALRKDFPTNRSKKEFMKKHHINESGDMESDKKRTEESAAIVNEERKKQGLKPKTVHDLVGDSRKIPGRTKYFIP